MALHEIKTNIQKQETKKESHTNGSYKIRQIMLKIVEYMHIHVYILISIYTDKQSQKSPRKIKPSRLTQQTKEIRNYICQFRTKLVKA